MTVKLPVAVTQFVPCYTKEEAIRFHDEFVKTLRKKTYPEGTQMERHHILPLHNGGSKEPENLIRISTEDHVAIHFYRFQGYVQIGDKVAFTMRIGDTNERARARAQAAVAANRSKKQLFWYSDWQAVHGRKGGAVAGSMNTPAQWAARQKVGLVYGRVVGLSNQSDKLKQILAHEIEWLFEPNQTIYTTIPMESASEIIRALERFHPGRIKNYSTFYKVLHGDREKMYGWRLVNLVIRSEAEI